MVKKFDAVKRLALSDIYIIIVFLTTNGGKKWDLIYIDGSHDYEVVSNDFKLSYENLNDNGLIVIDDSSLNLEYDKELGLHQVDRDW